MSGYQGWDYGHGSNELGFNRTKGGESLSFRLVINSTTIVCERDTRSGTTIDEGIRMGGIHKTNKAINVSVHRKLGKAGIGREILS